MLASTILPILVVWWAALPGAGFEEAGTYFDLGADKIVGHVEIEPSGRPWSCQALVLRLAVEGIMLQGVVVLNGPGPNIPGKIE